MMYVLLFLKNFFSQAFKQISLILHERLYYNYLVHLSVSLYELLHARGSDIINSIPINIYNAQFINNTYWLKKMNLMNHTTGF